MSQYVTLSTLNVVIGDLTARVSDLEDDTRRIEERLRFIDPIDVRRINDAIIALGQAEADLSRKVNEIDARTRGLDVQTINRNIVELGQGETQLGQVETQLGQSISSGNFWSNLSSGFGGFGIGAIAVIGLGAFILLKK